MIDKATRLETIKAAAERRKQSNGTPAVPMNRLEKKRAYCELVKELGPTATRAEVDVESVRRGLGTFGYNSFWRARTDLKFAPQPRKAKPPPKLRTDVGTIFPKGVQVAVSSDPEMMPPFAPSAADLDHAFEVLTELSLIVAKLGGVEATRLRLNTLETIFDAGKSD